MGVSFLGAAPNIVGFLSFGVHYNRRTNQTKADPWKLIQSMLKLILTETNLKNRSWASSFWPQHLRSGLFGRPQAGPQLIVPQVRSAWLQLGSYLLWVDISHQLQGCHGVDPFVFYLYGGYKGRPPFLGIQLPKRAGRKLSQAKALAWHPSYPGATMVVPYLRDLG